MIKHVYLFLQKRLLRPVSNQKMSFVIKKLTSNTVKSTKIKNLCLTNYNHCQFAKTLIYQL